jgi:drug/metabolite transporter (DMT)-like permease
MKIYILLVLCVLFWSGNFIIGRYISVDLDAFTLALFRWLLTALFISPVLIKNFSNILSSLKKNFLILNLLAIIGFSAFNTILYIGLHHTTATNALLINSSIPILILFFSFLILKTPISTKQFVGILLSTLGVVFLILKGEMSNLLELKLNIGDMWVILSSISWALYSVLLKFRPKDLSDIEFFSLSVYLGVFWLSIAYVLHGNNFIQDALHVKEFWWIFLYVALFASILSFYFWQRGIATLGASKVGQFTHLMPLFGSILAYIFLKERLHLYHLLGAAFIATGIYLSIFLKQKQ